jgi:hypothetical protein
LKGSNTPVPYRNGVLRTCSDCTVGVHAVTSVLPHGSKARADMKRTTA